MPRPNLLFVEYLLHPITWVVWTGTAALAASTTRNPLYLTLILGAVLITQHAYAACSASGQNTEVAGWRSLLHLALWLTLFTIPFNALSVHAGRIVLLRLPQNWPLIGGPITLEAIAWGACNALGLMTLMVAFTTFNLAVNQGQMLRLTPAFLYQAGLIVTIALTFFPQMIASAREIREAQLIRGHRMRRVRDMLPFVMALLTTGLEHSFQLAEAMEARGFGVDPGTQAKTRGSDLAYGTLTLTGLGGTLSGFFLLTYFEHMRLVGWTALGVSVALLIGAFWRQGRRTTRTHYHRDRWTRHDATALASTGVLLLALLWGRTYRPELLHYSPYTNMLPPFHLWIGAACLLSVVPALVGPARQSNDD